MPFAGKSAAAHRPAGKKLDVQLRSLIIMHKPKRDSKASDAHQEAALKRDLRKVGILTPTQRALGGRERIHGSMHTPVIQQKQV